MVEIGIGHWSKGKNAERIKEKILEGRRGFKHSEATKKKLSQSNFKNPRRYWLGKKHPQTEGAKQKLRQWTGNKRYNWKGDGVGYHALHAWLYRHFGKANKCENKDCKYPRTGRRWMEKPKRYEWANLSGKYKRDRTDWIHLCPSCHRKFDKE